MNSIAPGSSSLALDRGIDSIVFASEDQGSMTLPERAASTPAESAARPQLSLLLDKPSLGDWMAEAVRPRVLNRELLMPHRFQQALQDAHGLLKEAAAQRATQTGDQPEASLRVLNRATRLLAEEVNLRSLATMYRSALYQG